MKWELGLLLSEMRADQQESVTTDKLETYLALKRMRDFNDYVIKTNKFLSAVLKQ